MIKVNNTVSHKTSQGDVIVTKGKLVLIKLQGSIRTKEDILISDSKGNEFQPIIISETEKIEVGDSFYQSITSKIHHGANHPVEGGHKINQKILALPEHFSPKQLQAIVDGKMKDGDEVYVECETRSTPESEHAYIQNLRENCNLLVYFKIISLNSDNHITLHNQSTTT